MSPGCGSRDSLLICRTVGWCGQDLATQLVGLTTRIMVLWMAVVLRICTREPYQPWCHTFSGHAFGGVPWRYGIMVVRAMLCRWLLIASCGFRSHLSSTNRHWPLPQTVSDTSADLTRLGSDSGPTVIPDSWHPSEDVPASHNEGLCVVSSPNACCFFPNTYDMHYIAFTQVHSPSILEVYHYNAFCGSHHSISFSTGTIMKSIHFNAF